MWGCNSCRRTKPCVCVRAARDTVGPQWGAWVRASIRSAPSLCWAVLSTQGLVDRDTSKDVCLPRVHLTPCAPPTHPACTQELVDCDTSKDKGCSGGLMDFAFEYIHAKGGIHTEDSYPYTGAQLLGSCIWGRGGGTGWGGGHVVQRRPIAGWGQVTAGRAWHPRPPARECQRVVEVFPLHAARTLATLWQSTRSIKRKTFDNPVQAFPGRLAWQ
jgi:hypothetical protein